MKKNTLLLSILLCTVSLPTFLHADFCISSSPQKTGKIILVAGAVCAGVYGLYKLACWFFRKSDACIVQDVRTVMTRAAAYHPLLYAFYNQPTLDDQLETIAPQLVHDPQLWDAYKHALLALDAECHSLLKELAERIEQLEQKMARHTKIDRTYQKWETTMCQMRDCQQSLMVLCPQLDELSHFLSTYQDYFSLFGLLDDTRVRYRQELAALAEAPAPHEEFIDRCIMDNATQYGCTYPYLAYIDQLTNTNSRIGTLMHQVAQLHVGVPLRSRAQELINVLDTIKAAALRGGEQGPYYREREQKRIDDFKREELRIQQDLARAKEREAYAREREAHAQERKAEAQERSACAKERQAYEKGYENWMKPENTAWNRMVFDLTH